MKGRFFRLIAVSLSCALLISACASGSALVTGTKRQAISPQEVQLYTSPPARYEVIALVKASSDAGLTSQGSLDYAIQELKVQAAKVGANGILIRATGQSSSGTVITGSPGFLYGIPVTAENVSGEAIFVTER
jgi:hypothetical protein